MAKVELKKPIVEEIAENVKGADSVILVNYLGINVAGDTALRKELREAGVVYKVYKNTMMNFAFKGTDYEPLCEHLEGANAIAISKDDATAGARIIKKHLKANPTIKMMAGIVEGKYYDEKAVEMLADIPSREVLLGRLFGSMQSPVANFARVIKQIAEKDGGEAQVEA
jgi:large subunit ribosomal protein L10